MVAAFKNVLLISNFESSLVQAAFYGGYCFMAIPAALYIRRAGCKRGILVGLSLYAIGCLLFVPAGSSMQFWAFLAAYFTMTCGLSFLETTANPYIMAMGPEENAARRLNFAQAFNPVGTLAGMFVAKDMILAKLDPRDEKTRRELLESDPTAFQQVQVNDLSIIVTPYVVLGLVVLAIFLIFALAKLHEGEATENSNRSFKISLSRLFSNPRYIGGVIAQAFYVGVQIMCWTFIIQYGVKEVGIDPTEAQRYNIFAMAIFVTSRFICTYLLKFFNPGMLLASLAVAGGGLVLGTIFLQGYAGLYCLVGISACMSLMFPTIYGIALEGLREDSMLTCPLQPSPPLE